MPFRTFALPLLAAVGIFIPAALAADEGTYQLQTGDVVFQCTGGEQAKAIREATGSRYTHCGVVFEDNGTFKVLEASQPVKVTPIADFRRRSLPGTFQVRR